MPYFAILGGGRLARHMRHYLSLLNLPHASWTRSPASGRNTHDHPDAAQRLRDTVDPATHVLLLVSDSGIASVLRRHPFLRDKTLVHCSGALSLPGVAGAHPLMTFGDELYSLDEYRRIPFAVDAGHRFTDLLPGLPNPHHPVPVELKARYHALCVMAGNFSQVLWHTVSRRFTELGLPPETLTPYLERVVENFVASPDTALTGPLVRGDWQTIERNLQALNGDSLEPLYQAFLNHWKAEGAASPRREAAS